MAEQYNSILVIDDHKMVVNGVRLLIGSRFKHFYMAYDGSGGISAALEYHPELIVVDYMLPDTTGDQIVRELKYKVPTAKILAYSFTCSADAIVKMLRSGVNGYVLKTDDDQEFVRAIDALMENRDYFCKKARNHIINRFSTGDDSTQRQIIANTEFSAKEIELIKLLCKQMNTKEISDHLHLSERTVEQYRSNIVRRISAKNLAGVIKFALQNGVIQLDEL